MNLNGFSTLINAAGNYPGRWSAFGYPMLTATLDQAAGWVHRIYQVPDPSDAVLRQGTQRGYRLRITPGSLLCGYGLDGQGSVIAGFDLQILDLDKRIQLFSRWTNFISSFNFFSTPIEKWQHNRITWLPEPLVISGKGNIEVRFRSTFPGDLFPAVALHVLEP